MPEALKIVDHVPCIRCGYDLNTRPLDGPCPECGGPAREALTAFAFQAAWHQRRVLRGARVVAWAATIGLLITFATGFSGLLVVFLGGLSEYLVLIAVAGLTSIGPLLTAIGWAILTTPTPPIVLPDGSRVLPIVGPLRGVVRVLAWSYAICHAILVVLWVASSLSLVDGVNELMEHAVPALIALTVVLWSLRNALGSEYVRPLIAQAYGRKLKKLASLVKACFLALAIATVVLTVVAYSAPEWVAAPAMSSGMLIPLGLLAGAVLNLVFLHSLAARLRRCRRTGQEPASVLAPTPAADPAPV